jgi:uncharacterized protein
MDILIISLFAFGAAMLTFFSGFGLGTLLTPVCMVFFPVEIAISVTAIVHFLNNIFKLIIAGKGFNKNIVLRFGIPAMIAAIPGAWLMLHLSDMEALFSYELMGNTMVVYPIKFFISILLILFALMDLIPAIGKLQFNNKAMVTGGILSGFFGGLSGNQGAFRSIFLVRSGLSKESFVATTIVISAMVDVIRLSIYSRGISTSFISEYPATLIAASLAAMTGAFLGNKLLKKVTYRFIQLVVAIALILLSIALGSGLL